MKPCLPHQGHLDRGRAGKQSRAGVKRRAYVWAWIDANGEIPDGLQVNHICDNPACVEVTHLYVGTPGDNSGDMVRRGRSRGQSTTHCPSGHPLVEGNLVANLLVRKGQRKCLTCQRKQALDSYHRRKEAS